MTTNNTSVKNKDTKLTKEQQKVYDLLITGISTAEIAAKLGKTQIAVKDLITKVFRKHGVISRAQLIAAAKVVPVYISSTALPTETEIANFVSKKLVTSWPKVLKRAGLPADSVVATELLSILQAEFMQSSRNGV